MTTEAERKAAWAAQPKVNYTTHAVYYGEGNPCLAAKCWQVCSTDDVLCGFHAGVLSHLPEGGGAVREELRFAWWSYLHDACSRTKYDAYTKLADRAVALLSGEREMLA